MLSEGWQVVSRFHSAFRVLKDFGKIVKSVHRILRRGFVRKRLEMPFVSHPSLLPLPFRTEALRRRLGGASTVLCLERGPSLNVLTSLFFLFPCSLASFIVPVLQRIGEMFRCPRQLLVGPRQPLSLCKMAVSIAQGTRVMI